MAEGPCIRCGAEKSRNASGKVYCKPCGHANSRRWWDANKARANARQRARHQENRDADNAKSTARYRANRTAHYEATKRWQSQNRDLVLEYKRKWSSSHPEKGREYAAKRRALKLAGICEHGADCVSGEMLAQIICDPCAYCGGTATDGDHVVPLSRGGLNCRENIAPACGTCNKSKGNRPLVEWLAARGA